MIRVRVNWLCGCAVCSADALCSCCSVSLQIHANPLGLNSTAGPLTDSLSFTHTQKICFTSYNPNVTFQPCPQRIIKKKKILCWCDCRPNMTCDNNDIKTKNSCSSSSVNSNFIVQDMHWATMIQHSPKNELSCLLIWEEDQFWRACTAPIDYSNSGWVSLLRIP